MANKQDEALRHFARKLADISIEDGRVSAERVEGVLAAIAEYPARKQKPLLKHYGRYIEKEINATEATIESSGYVSEETLKQLADHLSDVYKRPVHATGVENKDLIAGIRIKVGDDIWDDSVAGHLYNLKAN